MPRDDGVRRRPSLSLPILRGSRNQHRAGSLTLGGLLSELGEASFGWAIVVFSLITLLPLPPGTTLITALPLLVATGQMMLGYPHVRLPGRLTRLRLDQGKLRRVVLGLRPVTRRLERVLRPRYPAFFARRHERLLGFLLFLIAFALFLPVPLSGWFPALALFVFGVGLVERDGLVCVIGLLIGAAAILITAVVLTSIAIGAEALMH